jgi:protein ImuA
METIYKSIKYGIAKLFSIFEATLLRIYSMLASKTSILAQLKKEILPLQGFKTPLEKLVADTGLGTINNAFPNATFPTGAVHEFIYSGQEDGAATGGFVAALLGSLMRTNGACLWISSRRLLYPPALSSFDIPPEKIIFIDLTKEKEIPWAMEEALKCEGISAVIGEMQELSFTTSRRLQLAVEQSRVTGFILRKDPRSSNTTACISRWKITCLPSELPGEMPGVGFPRWNVALVKIRNGSPGNWQVEFAEGRFRHISKVTSIVAGLKRKTG